MKHLFIINPAAGKGKSLNYIPKIQQYFLNNKGEYIIEVTKEPGHAIQLVKNYIKNDDYRIYSIGGDGTINEIVNGMIGSNSVLGVIPAGSGNDFIRSINDEKEYENILVNTIEGDVKKIDLGMVNERYFINIASVGLDADIVYNARRLKRIPFTPAGLAYLLSIFITVFRYQSKELKIRINDREFSSKTLLMTASNGKYYGGGMKVTPEARINDGKFDICHIRETSKLRILTLFPKLIKGEHGKIEEIAFYKGEEVAISSEDTMSLNIDGELLRAKEVKFNILPGAIKVIIPK